MPIASSHFDPALGALFADGREALGDVEWFDAHTHIGHNDPDGFRATTEEILAGLDAAGHRRALVFPMHEPDGYRDGQRRGAGRPRRRPAAASRRSRASTRTHRMPSRRPGAACWPVRAGSSCTRAATRFGLPHPVVERVVALAGEHRAIVLFHAGRGIPHLGEAVVDLARRHPRRALILAHAGISDLGWIAAAATRLPNLFFDTAWWQVSDLLQLYATVPPGQILYASDMPYGQRRRHLVPVRCASRPPSGLGRDALRSIAGGQLERVVAGEEPADLGPPPGRDALGPRVVEAERAAVYLSTALQLAYRGRTPRSRSPWPGRPARPCAPTATPRCSRSWPGCARWPSTRPAAGRTRRRP